jgi:membrane protease YdiL (CAAX protease family)
MRLTGSVSAAVGLCIVMFGVAHAMQGWKSAGAIMIFAAAFHLLVWLAGSLYVAMAVHFLYDLIAGFAYGHLAGKLGYSLPEGTGPAPLPATDSV